jgi:hypothetical protein
MEARNILVTKSKKLNHSKNGLNKKTGLRVIPMTVCGLHLFHNVNCLNIYSSLLSKLSSSLRYLRTYRTLSFDSFQSLQVSGR